MTETINQPLPKNYEAINEATRSSGFTMASDILTGSLLKALAASKPGGQFLELGTGTGLSTSWILDGMDRQSTLVSVDNDQQFLQIAQNFLGDDDRLQLINANGEEWILANRESRFDYIFADTWHGKYLMLGETLTMLNKGGFYIIDDMLPQPNWPEGHAEKADRLVETLEKREDLLVVKQNWATGIMICVKQ